MIGITREDRVKIAIPMFNSRVSPRFDFASKMLVATVEGGKVVDRENYSLINLNPIRRSALLSELGVNVLICGGISDFSVRLLMGNGIEVIPMVAGEVEDVLNLFINDNLNSAIIPMVSGRGYAHHPGRRGRCRGKGRGRGFITR
jgi:predicted Fe-Mo cluster-binding NifX family protein